MEFSFTGYGALLDLLKTNNYSFSDYHSWHDKEKPVILRHDLDYDISRAVSIAKIEHREGVKSTYFVLTTTDFYNVFSMENNKLLEELINLGHEIGLHFDEARYPDLFGNVDAIREKYYMSVQFWKKQLAIGFRLYQCTDRVKLLLKLT